MVFTLNTYKFKFQFKIMNLEKKKRSMQAKYFFTLATESYWINSYTVSAEREEIIEFDQFP